MEQVHRFKAGEADRGMRLDRLVSRLVPSLSRNQAQRLITGGKVLVNSRPERSSYRLHVNDEVEVRVPPPQPLTLNPEPIPLDIVYEDGDLLVVNKPSGLVVHPAAGHWEGTLVNALLNHCSDLSGIGGYLRPGIVHRLDKDTSGLLLVSKTDLAHRGLTAQLKARKIKRRYLALVHGEVPEAQGLIDAPLGRDPVHRKRFTVLSKGKGKEARTHYRVKERFSGYTLLEVQLETGRTHQIRVHLAYAGYPVAGDPVYGWRRNPLQLPGQALHAYRITFTHPRTGARLSFEAPLPPPFATALARLREGAGEHSS